MANVNVEDELHLKTQEMFSGSEPIKIDLKQPRSMLYDQEDHYLDEIRSNKEESQNYEISIDQYDADSAFEKDNNKKQQKMSFFKRIGLKKSRPQPHIETKEQHAFTDEEEDLEEEFDEDELSILSDSSSEETPPIPQISISLPTNSPTFQNHPANVHYVKTKTKNKKYNREFSRLLLAQTIATSFRPDPFTPSTPTEQYQNHYRMSSDSSAEPNSNFPYGAIWSLRFSKDGRYLASAGQNCVVHLYRLIEHPEDDYSIKVLDESPYREYTGHTADILDLAWSKNNFLLSSSMDHTVRLWHTSQVDCLCVFQHLNIVTSVVFHPKDDRFFLTSSMDSRIRIWSIPEKRVAFWNEIPGNKYATASAFTLDGKTVIVGSHDGHCYFFETQNLKYITQVSVTNDTNNHRNSSKKGPKITGIEVMPGMPPGDEKILITSNDSKVRLYNIKDKSLMFKYKGAENTSLQIKATFSDDGRYIISGSEDCNTYIWRTEQSSVSPFYHLQESRNKSFGDSLSIYDSQPSPQQQKRISKWLKRKDNPSNDNRIEYFEAHEYVVTTSIFAPTKTRQHIARSKQDTIYNNTPVHPRRLSAVSQSSYPSMEEDSYADGHILVTADFRGIIKVWRVDSGVYRNISVDTSNANQIPTDIPSPASLSSSSSTLGKSMISPSPKTKRSFGLFHSRHSK